MMKRLNGSIVIVCICAGVLLLIGKKGPVSAIEEPKIIEATTNLEEAESVEEAGGMIETEAVEEAEIMTETETEEEVEVLEETETEEEVKVLEETKTEEEVKALEETETVEETEEYVDLAIAQVERYVNVRKEPNTDCEIVGKMYNGSVAQILAKAGEESDWLQVVSGNVEGYIKAEYFICGEDALQVIDEYVIQYVQVQADRLNVRKEPDVQSKKIGYLNRDEKVKLLEDCGDWCKVLYTDEKEGYVSAEYVLIVEEYVYAKSIEEERAEQKAKEEALARQKALEAEKQQSAEQDEEPKAEPNTEYATNDELRQNIVDYAMQYLGNVYINGGKSLETGTDCSGFTCFIYRDFGYSISRTPSGQYNSDGRNIDYADAKPGDILCYSSNGKSCTHVALYIGNGEIIHAANSRKGVVIGKADYSPIIAVKNIID